MPPFEKNRTKQQYQLSKEKEELYKLNQNKLLKLFTKGNQNAISNYYLVYQRFREAINEKKNNKPQISSKMKGRIVLQLTKYQSNTSIAEAFIRWKVRTDPEMVKRAVDKILLNSKLNQFNAFQKLKFLVGKTNAKENRMNAKKRKNYSLLQLALFIQKKEYQLKKQAIEDMKPKGQDTNKMLGLLMWSINSKHRERYLREKFNWWRLISKIKSDRLTKQIKALERLGDEYNMKNDRLNRQRLKEAFEIWRGDLQNHRLKKKFFGVLLKTTFGRLQRCYTRWVDLPDKRENDMKKQGMLLITKLCNKVDLHKRQIWNSFKDLNDDAKNKKTKVIRELIEVTFNQSYNAFYKWANYNTYAKLTETNLKKIKSLQNSANITNQIVKIQTFKLFNLSKKMDICLSIDKLIQKIQQRQKQEAITQIQNYLIQKKMQEQLNNINKTDLIQRLKETSNKTKNGLLRLILKKFQQNNQIQEIKHKYFGKILLSVNGLLIDSFRKWKILPDPDEALKLQKASKFQIKLSLFINNKNKQSFDNLKTIHYDAIQKKRYCIKKLMHVTMSAPQKYLKLWSNTTKIYKSVIACQKTNNFFDSLALIIKSNILSFMINKTDADKKQKCIIKIISGQHNNLSIAFNLWKTHSNQEKIKEQLGDEQKKLFLLNLQKFIQNNQNQRQRRILKLFYNQILVSQQIKKIQLKLMQTVIGQVQSSFYKWKSLPESQIGNAAKVSKFALSLGKVTNRYIKIHSWNILEDYLLDGQAKKKFCINKIRLSGHSDIKTAFLIWHRRAWEMKMFDQFSQLNVTLNDQIIKQKLINWINAGFKVKNYALVEILRRFNQFALSQNQRRKALAIIHRNTISQVWISFNKWKQIPEVDYSEFSKISKFESSLNKFSLRLIRKQSWNPLQEVYDDALAIKKRSVLLLVKTQESEQQKTINKWNKNVSLMVEVDRYKSVILLFKFIGQQIQNNLSPFKQDENSKIKEKAIKMIIQGANDDLRNAFQKWQQMVRQQIYQATEAYDKKVYVIKNLTAFLQNNAKAQMRKILFKFKENNKIKKIKDKFFMKLIATTFGGAVMAFEKWKNIPVAQNKEALRNARKFELALQFLFRVRVNQSFEPLKDEYFEGNNRKLFCVRKMMILAMGQNKRLFQQWKNMTILSKQIESCKHTTNFFTDLSLILASNVQTIFKPNKLQKSTLQKIFLNFTNAQRWAFNKWLNQTKQDKIGSLIDDEQKKYLLLALSRNLKHNAKGQLRDVLRIFDKSRKTQNLIKMIQLKIMNTLIGQVESSFQKWKQIREYQNVQKASQFEKGLSKINTTFIKRNSFNQLINIYYEGQAKQKYYMNKLVYNCMNVEKKAFLQWHKISRIEKTEERANKVISFFDTVSKLQQINLTILVEEQVKGQKKYQELARLLKEWEDMFKDSYQKWKQTQAKLDLIANQQRNKQKCSILDILKDYIQNKKNYKLRMVLRKFNFENENQKAKNKYLIQLQNTQIGKLQHSFLIWNRLPERQKTKEACIFEKRIFQIFRKSLLNSYDALQDLYYQALNKKRRAVLLLIKTTQSQQQKAIEKWYNIIQQQNLLKQQNIDENKKLAIQLFYQHKLNQLNVAYILWRNNVQNNKNHTENEQEKQLRLKRQALLLFQNYGQIKLRLYFTKWKVRSVKNTMIQICNAIQRMISLNKFSERAIKKYVIDIWKSQPSKNKWFKRVAEMIAKNSKLNKQVAYWRMRDNCINLKAASLTTQQIIKCKKLFNNLIKAFDRIKQRAFTHLEHYGKGIQDDNSFQPSQTSFLQQTPIKEIKDVFFRSQMGEDLSMDQNTIQEQQRQIQELKKRVEKISIQKLYKLLEQLQDHLIEDGFNYIYEYQQNK